MKIKQMEHVDDFEMGEFVFWIEVTDVPKHLVEQAKMIDGENYSEDCFGVCAGANEDEYYICEDSSDSELYYVDNNGDKHWLKYVLSEAERNEIFEFCKYENSTQNFKACQEAMKELSVADLVRAIDYFYKLQEIFPDTNEVFDDFNDILKPLTYVASACRTYKQCPHCGCWQAIKFEAEKNVNFDPRYYE
jgi:hypothetical protein